MTIAIIGAGMAGLACARALTQADEAVTVFEKSRGIGGRCATRRSEHGAYDHGAPYVQAWTINFKAMLAASSLSGSALPWPQMDAADTAPAYVGAPGMSALVKPLATGCDIRLGARIDRIDREDSGWTLRDQAGVSRGSFARLCLAIPAPQAVKLLARHALATRVAAAIMVPCWTLMTEIASPTRLQSAQMEEPFHRIIVDSDKPGRTAEPSRVVVHMSTRWSQARLECEMDDAASLIMAELTRYFPIKAEDMRFPVAHRWRYALTQTPLGEAFLWDARDKLGVCGDWCLGPQAEDAFLSGRALADRILGG